LSSICSLFLFFARLSPGSRAFFILEAPYNPKFVAMFEASAFAFEGLKSPELRIGEPT
jgi:hypothetical protein